MQKALAVISIVFVSLFLMLVALYGAAFFGKFGHGFLCFVCFALFLGIIIAAVLAIQRVFNLPEEDRLRQGHCPECDYNMYGLPELRCPECGWQADDRAAQIIRPQEHASGGK